MHSLQVKKLSKVLRSPLKPLPEPDLNPSLCPSAAALLLPLSFHRRLQSSGSHWLMLLSVKSCEEGGGGDPEQHYVCLWLYNAWLRIESALLPPIARSLPWGQTVRDRPSVQVRDTVRTRASLKFYCCLCPSCRDSFLYLSWWPLRQKEGNLEIFSSPKHEVREIFQKGPIFSDN